MLVGRILLLMGERLCFSFGFAVGRCWLGGVGLMVRGGGLFWVFGASEAVALRLLRLLSKV